MSSNQPYKQPPVLILGNYHDVEVGFRQLRRSTKVECASYQTPYGSLRIPTLDELMGMKAYLCYIRNATRDFLDFAALSALVPQAEALKTLLQSQQRYGDLQTKSVALDIAKTLSDPQPYDLEGLDLTIYKGIQEPWNEWQRVAEQCSHLGQAMGERLVQHKGDL